MQRTRISQPQTEISLGRQIVLQAPTDNDNDNHDDEDEEEEEGHDWDQESGR
jgi:hypothetical protein